MKTKLFNLLSLCIAFLLVMNYLITSVAGKAAAEEVLEPESASDETQVETTSMVVAEPQIEIETETEIETEVEAIETAVEPIVEEEEEITPMPTVETDESALPVSEEDEVPDVDWISGDWNFDELDVFPLYFTPGSLTNFKYGYSIDNVCDESDTYTVSIDNPSGRVIVDIDRETYGGYYFCMVMTPVNGAPNVSCNFIINFPDVGELEEPGEEEPPGDDEEEPGNGNDGDNGDNEGNEEPPVDEVPDVGGLEIPGENEEQDQPESGRQRFIGEGGGGSVLGASTETLAQTGIGLREFTLVGLAINALMFAVVRATSKKKLA